MSIERARAHLKKHGLEERIQEFTVSSATVALAAEALGCEPARIAKSLSFMVDGKAVGIFRWNEGSGGWQNWETVSGKVSEKLTKGEHVIEFEFGTAVNVNWFEVTPE